MAGAGILGGGIKSNGRPWTLYTQVTEDGVAPPRFRLIGQPGRRAECDPYNPRAEQFTIEPTKEGLKVVNQSLYDRVDQLSKSLLTSVVYTGNAMMITGWNAAASHFYERGFHAGVAKERERAGEVRAAKGKASRELHDEVTEAVKETGESRSTAAERILRERVEAKKAEQEGPQR